MDAKRLAQLEAIVSGMGVGHQASNDLVEELITAHGELVCEAEQLREDWKRLNEDSNEVALKACDENLALTEALDIAHAETKRLRERIIDSAVTHYGLTHAHWAQSEGWPWPAKSEAPESEQE